MRKAVAWSVLAVAVISTVLIWRLPVIHWAQAQFGFRQGDGDSPHYLFWSGIGSDLAYLSIIGGAVIYYRKENCKKRWCPLLGHYELTDRDGIVRKLCWVHHPDVHKKQLTSEHISRISEFRRKHPVTYLGDKPGKG